MEDYDIVIITESWLLSSINDSEIADDRYDIFRRDRNYTKTGQRFGGGVLILVKRSFNAVRNMNFQSSLEDIWVSFLIKDTTRHRRMNRINICSFYIPDGVNYTADLEIYLEKLSSNVTGHPDDLFLVTGDFNRPEIKWAEEGSCLKAYGFTDNISKNFIDTLHFCSLKQYCSAQNNFNNVLDLVLSTSEVKVVTCDSPLVPETIFHR